MAMSPKLLGKELPVLFFCIFRKGISAHGLTTAVTVWCCAAIGCLTAAGYYAEKFIGTSVIIIIILKPIDEWLSKRLE